MSEGHFIIPASTYKRTLIALLILTVITVAVARVDLSAYGEGLNLIVAMFVAIIKATLVCCFFMGLKYDRIFNVLVFLSSIFFLFFFFALTFSDTMTRDEIDIEKSIPFDELKNVQNQIYE